MHTSTLAAACLLAVAMICPGGCGAGTDWQTYEAALDSGRDEIDVVQEIERLFPDQAQHFITHYGFHSGPNTWHSEVLLHERYVLKLNVKVQLNRTFTAVVDVVEEPRFFLKEHKTVVPETGGTWRRIAGEQWDFGPNEWRQVVDANGDFSQIGIDLKTDEPVENFSDSHFDTRRQRERRP